MPRIFLSTDNVLNAPDISFPRDCEPVATPFDRHAATRAPKKTRQKKSAIRAAVYGGPTSRAQSRASSRAASRFGGSAIALRSTVMATKLVQLARASADSFQIVPWHDGVSKRLETPGVGAHWEHDSDGTASVAGTTSRRQVDVAEIHRRIEIERDISTREARRQLTQRIQRKSELPLKLRSLADPTVSFDKQEVLAATAARGGAASRLGTRPPDTRIKTPAIGPPLSSLTKSVSTASGFSNASKPGLDGDDPSITFRSEDYRDISSTVVLLGRGGEVLVGDNCFLVGRKPRGEISRDLGRKAAVEPRISLLEPLAHDHESPATGPESLPSSPQGGVSRSAGKSSSLHALSVNKSPSLIKSSATERGQVREHCERIAIVLLAHKRFHDSHRSTRALKGVWARLRGTRAWKWTPPRRRLRRESPSSATSPVSHHLQAHQSLDTQKGSARRLHPLVLTTLHRSRVPQHCQKQLLRLHRTPPHHRKMSPQLLRRERKPSTWRRARMHQSEG